MIRPALSGLAGQQTYPGAPYRAADPEFRGLVGERLRGEWGAPVGVEYRPGGEGVITARHLQRVDDQVGSHVRGQRVADAGLGVAVDNGGQYVESGACQVSSGITVRDLHE